MPDSTKAGDTPSEEEFREDCPCPKKKCERHGHCMVCRAHHGRRNHLPYCERGHPPRRRLSGLFSRRQP